VFDGYLQKYQKEQVRGNEVIMKLLQHRRGSRNPGNGGNPESTYEEARRGKGVSALEVVGADSPQR
jgi:hypothetical protein